MPIKPCTKDGQSGYKYGDSGHCYTGEGAKEKAAKQAAAIKISQSKSSFVEEFFEELNKNLENKK